MQITLPNGSNYPIMIEQGAFKHLPALISGRQTIIITDENVAKYWLEPLQKVLQQPAPFIVLPAGESTKSFSQLEKLLNELLEMRVDRQTVLIALGGGVVGDITGFAASIVLRGIPFIQIPTTLLSQVDSSVGGKTGINTPAGKNLVGSFYQPLAVLIDSDVLQTLPDREIKAGFAEILKAALIDDASLFDWLEQNYEAVLRLKPKNLEYAISKAIAIKARIVEQDERELGRRALLNLGHTFAHAIETEFAYKGMVNHGEAVAIGLAMAAHYSAFIGILTQNTADRVFQLIKRSGLVVQPPHWPKADDFIAMMRKDKKANKGDITLILMENIGDCKIVNRIDEASLVAFINAYRQKEL